MIGTAMLRRPCFSCVGRQQEMFQLSAAVHSLSLVVYLECLSYSMSSAILRSPHGRTAFRSLLHGGLAAFSECGKCRGRLREVDRPNQRSTNQRAHNKQAMMG
ncbi:unnamed protein product, partial [Ectocarpus sp. 12 AP-2014]